MKKVLTVALGVVAAIGIATAILIFNSKNEYSASNDAYAEYSNMLEENSVEVSSMTESSMHATEQEEQQTVDIDNYSSESYSLYRELQSEMNAGEISIVPTYQSKSDTDFVLSNDVLSNALKTISEEYGLNMTDAIVHDYGDGTYDGYVNFDVDGYYMDFFIGEETNAVLYGDDVIKEF